MASQVWNTVMGEAAATQGLGRAVSSPQLAEAELCTLGNAGVVVDGMKLLIKFSPIAKVSMVL